MRLENYILPVFFGYFGFLGGLVTEAVRIYPSKIYNLQKEEEVSIALRREELNLHILSQYKEPPEDAINREIFFRTITIKEKTETEFDKKNKGKTREIVRIYKLNHPYINIWDIGKINSWEIYKGGIVGLAIGFVLGAFASAGIGGKRGDDSGDSGSNYFGDSGSNDSSNNYGLADGHTWGGSGGEN